MGKVIKQILKWIAIIASGILAFVVIVVLFHLQAFAFFALFFHNNMAFKFIVAYIIREMPHFGWLGALFTVCVCAIIFFDSLKPKSDKQSKAEEDNQLNLLDILKILTTVVLIVILMYTYRMVFRGVAS